MSADAPRITARGSWSWGLARLATGVAIVFAAILLWCYARAERGRYEEEALGTAQRIMEAVDCELVGIQSAAQALATSEGNFGAGFGNDIVTDFQAGASSEDVLEFSLSIFSNFNAALTAASQVGSDVVISLDANNSVTLKNTQLSALHADDFRFA